eukprot:gene17029-biopygen12777
MSIRSRTVQDYPKIQFADGSIGWGLARCRPLTVQGKSHEHPWPGYIRVARGSNSCGVKQDPSSAKCAPAGPTRYKSVISLYHCDASKHQCVEATSGHSTKEKCEAACAPPQPNYACVVDGGQKSCGEVPPENFLKIPSLPKVRSGGGVERERSNHGSEEIPYDLSS